MRVTYILFATVAFLAACTTKQEPQAENSNVSPVEDSATVASVVTPDSTKQQVLQGDTDKAQTFLALFKPINPRGFHAYSPEFSDDLKVLNKQFEGVPIDAKKYQSLLKGDAVPYLKSIVESYGGIFAIGKFDITSQYTGLVVRQRSQYSDTQLALMLWDKQKKEVVQGLELADMFGDEGWFFDTESWMTEFVPNEKLVIVSRTKNFDPNEDFTSGTVTDSMKISRFSNGKFSTKTTTSLDTANFKLKRWKQ